VLVGVVIAAGARGVVAGGWVFAAAMAGPYVAGAHENFGLVRSTPVLFPLDGRRKQGTKTDGWELEPENTVLLDLSLQEREQQAAGNIDQRVAVRPLASNQARWRPVV
jgi:hypothetical protein